MPFNTRIIAATNAKIGDEAMVGRFREDLYYRLAIITIHTPPLNQRKEDIPMLLVHFLSEAVHNGGPGMLKSMPKVSRGALVKFMEYNWPGNVRELKNCVTNALTFCEGGIIFAEDIRIGSEISAPLKHPQSMPQTGKAAEQRPEQELLESTAAGARPEESSLDVAPEGKLNPRQRRLLPHIVAKGGVSRHEYQTLSGENISARTALYDLQAFVGIGILRKEGRGPALRYVPARKETKIQMHPPRSAAA